MADSATKVAEGSISKNEQKRQIKVFIIIIFAAIGYSKYEWVIKILSIYI